MGLFDIFRKNKSEKPQPQENKCSTEEKKVFEDEFTDIQTDMISICLENVEGRADMIYVYGSYEAGTIVCTYFYNIHGMVVSRGKLNEALISGEPLYDVSVERQKQVTEILMDDMKQLKAVCEKYQKPMPTELKLTYNVGRNSLNADYQYENVYSNQQNKDAYAIAEEWMALERKHGA